MSLPRSVAGREGLAHLPSLLVIGHGTRSAPGVRQYWSFLEKVRSLVPSLEVGGGFIELARPDLAEAIDRLAAAGARSIVGVPLVLLGAGHLKTDGPHALAAARTRHGDVRFTYARDLGIHPLVLDVASERIASVLAELGGAGDDSAVVLVGRGSSDPDANADMYKVARLLSDSRGLGAIEPAFVSLAAPSVPEALDRTAKLGARRIAVVPYFLFTGRLVDRIHRQAEEWGAARREERGATRGGRRGSRGTLVRTGPELGPDPRIARLVVDRYHEALSGEAAMNCDCCIYRTPLPGYEHRVGTNGHHDHSGEIDHHGTRGATRGATA